jgi:hypothetical protein
MVNEPELKLMKPTKEDYLKDRIEKLEKMVMINGRTGKMITRNEYRKALHIYLIHAYPEDDVEYYSKWGFIAHPHFWERTGEWPFPTEVRFGCHCSGNTKLRCYPSGFLFDTNHVGDPQWVIDEVKKIKKDIEDDWRKNGIKVHGDPFEDLKM